MNETTKRNLLIGLIFLSSAPALLLVPIPDHVTLKTFSLYASQVFGYFGLLLLLWSYIIGARSVFALWFRDLAPVLKIHKLLGKYGSLAVLLHPLLVTYYYGESLLYSAIPHIGSVRTSRDTGSGSVHSWSSSGSRRCSFAKNSDIALGNLALPSVYFSTVCATAHPWRWDRLCCEHGITGLLLRHRRCYVHLPHYFDCAGSLTLTSPNILSRDTAKLPRPPTH